MAGSYLVITICDNERCASTVNTTSKKLEQIEGCLVCPVHILQDYKCRRPSLEFVQGRVENDLSIASATDCVQQRALGLPGDVVEGRKWPGCEQRVTDPPQDAAFPLLETEFLQKGRFPNPGFTTDHANASRPVTFGHPLLQPGETRVALEERRMSTGIGYAWQHGELQPEGMT